MIAVQCVADYADTYINNQVSVLVDITIESKKQRFLFIVPRSFIDAETKDQAEMILSAIKLNKYNNVSPHIIQPVK